MTGPIRSTEALPQVELLIEPDERLTTDWLKRLIADAREWAEGRKEAA